jgi:hypothetical protein
MVRPQDTLADGQGTLMERLGLTVATLVTVDLGQVIAAGGGVGMVRPQDTLTNGQGTLMERLGLTVATLGLVD